MEALQKARGTVAVAPPQLDGTAAFNLTRLLECEEITFEAGAAFSVEGLDVDDGEKAALLDRHRKFAAELKAKVAELFGGAAPNLSQLRAEAASMRTRLAASPLVMGQGIKAPDADAASPVAQPAGQGPAAAQSAQPEAARGVGSAAPGGGVDVAVPRPVRDPDLEGKAKQLLRAARGEDPGSPSSS